MVQFSDMASTSADETPRRATRKRATRKSTTATRKRTVKRTTKKVTEEAPVTRKKAEPVVEAPAVETETAHSTASTRKAPTPLAGQRSQKKRKQRRIFIVGVVLAIGVLSSAGIGYTDPGEIDINATIEARNERLRTNTASQNDTEFSRVNVPVQNRGNATEPDGGLRGLGSAPAQPAPPPPATSTATSTATTTDNQSATSTEDGIDESASASDAVREEIDEVEEEGVEEVGE
jgi:hypothetical protein